MKNKFLIFELRDICYNSCVYFADSMAAEMRRAGHEVEIYRGSSEDLEGLEKYIGKSYTACLEFNSFMPKVSLDEDSLFLDSIDAPFYNFILDHPLYHHDILKQNLKNFHVICLDEDHKEYIKTYYPHIKSVHVIPVTGEEAKTPEPVKNRDIDIIFTGTYINPGDIQTIINGIPGIIKKDINKLIDLMLSHNGMPQEQAMKMIMNESEVIREDNFHVIMHSYFLADTFARAYMREYLIKTILKAGIPLTVCGSKWEELKTDKISLLRNIPSMPFKDTFPLMSQAKIVLNIMPLFKKGSHDRVFSAMLNHSVSLTDSSIYLEEVFNQGDNIVFYPLDHMEIVPDMLTDLLMQPNKLEEIAESGYQEARKNHTWENRVEEFLKIFEVEQ